MQKIKVKITNGPAGSWYEQHIRKEFWVYSWGSSYVLQVDYDHGFKDLWRHIEKSDCVVVDESPSPSLPETEQGALTEPQRVERGRFLQDFDNRMRSSSFRRLAPGLIREICEKYELHAHVPLKSGGVAKVSPDASPDLINALETMVDLAKKMPDPDQPVPEEVMEWIDAYTEENWPQWMEMDLRDAAKLIMEAMYKRDQAIIWKAEADRNNALAEEERLANLLTTAMHEIKDMRKEYTSLQSRLSSTEAERDAIRKAFDLQAEELKKYRKQ